jgi:hypothetical protein
MNATARGLLPLALAVLLACGDEPAPDPPAPQPTPGTQVLLRFGAGFFDAPFPGEHRRRPDGRPDTSGFPGAGSSKLLDKILAILDRDADGFGLTSAVFLPLSAPLDPTRLPSLQASVSDNAAVAAAGWGGLSIDGPHGGLRNVSNGDEQFLMFNVTNPRTPPAP